MRPCRKQQKGPRHAIAHLQIMFPLESTGCYRIPDKYHHLTSKPSINFNPVELCSSKRRTGYPTTKSGKSEDYCVYCKPYEYCALLRMAVPEFGALKPIIFFDDMIQILHLSCGQWRLTTTTTHSSIHRLPICPRSMKSASITCKTRANFSARVVSNTTNSRLSRQLPPS